MPGPVGSTGLSDYRLRLVEWPRSPLESRLPAACPRDGCGWRSADSCCLPQCCWGCAGNRSRGSVCRQREHAPGLSLFVLVDNGAAVAVALCCENKEFSMDCGATG